MNHHHHHLHLSMSPMLHQNVSPIHYLSPFEHSFSFVALNCSFHSGSFHSFLHWLIQMAWSRLFPLYQHDTNNLCLSLDHEPFSILMHHLLLLLLALLIDFVVHKRSPVVVHFVVVAAMSLVVDDSVVVEIDFVVRKMSLVGDFVVV